MAPESKHLPEFSARVRYGEMFTDSEKCAHLSVPVAITWGHQGSSRRSIEVFWGGGEHVEVISITNINPPGSLVWAVMKPQKCWAKNAQFA